MELTTLSLGVLASGEGTNLQAVIDACAGGEIPARVAMVISDREGSGALRRAGKAGIERHFVDRSRFPGKEDFESKIVSLLREAGVELVLLAGYMRLVGRAFVAAFPQRIMNIHPSLLPAFPGLESVRQALAYGVKVTGVTVHFVDEGLDTGPIIVQEPVVVREGEDETSLLERVHRVEHALYPRAIRLFAEGKLQVEDRIVKVEAGT